MSKAQVRGVVSTVLVIAFLLCFVTGVILFFLKAGMWGIFTRHFLKDVHNITGFIFGGGCVVHFLLNFKVYLREMRSLRKPEQTEADIPENEKL